MPGYRQIIVAVDFSPLSEPALKRAAEVANAEARLTLLHVIGHFPEDIPVAPVAPEGADVGEFLRRDALGKLQALARHAGCERAKAQANLTEGAIAGEIARSAQTQRADLVVVGAHGGSGILARLGSTASAVLTECICDVLVVRRAHH